ncbi:hypothetical protein [Streptomyces qinzhouensis]|uniref:Uncharacterized protein n=1 Tax=Streptomyces qinzhouensis TaxID=2599401 RepID=A0A5B8JDP0_9ACTN|nr:hypothetical protein [Streptomyces qinzhouensis]QDY75563.1 hypothetical protein FQU76_02495 [Streptomyces qinzhouensis]
MDNPRLTAGTALVTVPGRGLALRTPDGTFLRVDTGDVPEADLVRLFGGGAAEAPEQPAPRPTGGHEPGPARLLAAFEEAGYATRNPAPQPEGPLAGTTLLLLGDPVLTRPVARLARAMGAEPMPIAAEELPARAAAEPRTAVVWCLDGPVPPGLWDPADRLSRDGVRWARCHREGADVWLEPPARGPYGVTAADIRLRRLAATPAHRELAAYWAGSRTPDNGPRHTAASAAYTAALLVHDLVTHVLLGPDRVPPVLRRIDLRDLAATAHPVLPVPECAPLPAGRDTP